MNFRLLMIALMILGSSAHGDPPVRPWALENPGDVRPQPVAPQPLSGQPMTVVAPPPPLQGASPTNAPTQQLPLQQLMQSLSKSPGNNNGGGSQSDTSSNSYNDTPDVYGEPCKTGDKPDAKGLAGMLSCIRDQKSYNVTNQTAFFVDYQKKQGFVVDKDTGAIKYCVRISTGKGVGIGYGQSARGLSITTSHHGDYDSGGAKGPAADCIGLAGTGTETRERESKGCILHKAHGGEGRNSTLGCIGIEDSNWPEFKRIMYGSDQQPKRSAVFLYDSKSGPTCDGTRPAPSLSSPPTKSEVGS